VRQRAAMARPCAVAPLMRARVESIGLRGVCRDFDIQHFQLHSRAFVRWRIATKIPFAFSSLRKLPSIDDVTADEAASRHRASHAQMPPSITTPTPCGSIVFWIASAICVVSAPEFAGAREAR